MFKEFCRHLFKPIWKPMLSGFPILYRIFVFVRDEFLPPEVSEKLRLLDIFEMLEWYWLVIGSLILWGIWTSWSAAKVLYIQTVESKKITVVSHRIKFVSSGKILLESAAEYDYTNVYAKIISFEGIYDPRFAQPQLPSNIKIYSAESPFGEQRILESKSMIMLLPTAYNKIDRYCSFVSNKGPIRFLGTGKAIIRFSGKAPDGKRVVKNLEVTVIPNDGKYHEMKVREFEK